MMGNLQTCSQGAVTGAAGVICPKYTFASSLSSLGNVNYSVTDTTLSVPIYYGNLRYCVFLSAPSRSPPLPFPSLVQPESFLVVSSGLATSISQIRRAAASLTQTVGSAFHARGPASRLRKGPRAMYLSAYFTEQVYFVFAWGCGLSSQFFCTSTVRLQAALGVYSWPVIRRTGWWGEGRSVAGDLNPDNPNPLP